MAQGEREMSRLMDVVWVMVGLTVFYFFVLLMFSLEV
jgi:hypothetical protein